jgi:uncharacterized protein YegL
MAHARASQAWRWVLLGGAATLMLSLLIPAAHLAAQEADTPTLEIVSVHHNPAGTLSVGLRADGGRETSIQGITMFVDDVPVTLDVNRRETVEDLAVLLVIDTSGSMAGVPMQAARESARQLIDRLAAEDRVGLVSFDSTVVVRSDLTNDHDAVRALVAQLNAIGSTALYEAISQSALMLDGAPEERRVIVLLSDGEDLGGVSETTREESLERAAASGVIAYAVGLGPDYDEEYLIQLAEATEGQFFGIRDESDTATLTALFQRIGGELGSNEVYEIPVRTLAQGTHRLSVRGVVNGVPVSSQTTFEVTNAGLLTIEVIEPASDGGAFEIAFSPAAQGAGLTVEARVDGVTFRPSSPTATSLNVDPWRLSPGTHEVEIIARTGTEVAVRETVTLEVPALAPSLTLTERNGEWVARGRVQQAERPTIAARTEDGEIASSNTGELVVAAGELPITVELVDASGAVVATEEIAAVGAVVAAGGGISPALLVLAVVVLGAGAFWFRRRRKRAPSEPRYEEPPLRRTSPRVAAETEPGEVAASPSPSRGVERPMALMVIRDINGNQRHEVLSRRPRVIGSGERCDIVLEDPEVRARHATITSISAEEVQIHALSDRGSRPYDERDDDEWLVVHHGEQIVLGSHYIQFVMGDEAIAAVQRGDDPSDDDDAGRDAQAEAGG